jgi:transposase-like protein
MSGRTSKTYPVELRERAVRMVAEMRSDHESGWAAMTQVAQLLGVGTQKGPQVVPAGRGRLRQEVRGHD